MVELQDISRLIEEGTAYTRTEKSGTGQRLQTPTGAVSDCWISSGADTGGAFSSHLVRVQKGCEFQIISRESVGVERRPRGAGKMILDGRILFGPGDTFTTPPGVRHTVVADKEDIALLAVFVPGTM